MKLNLLLRTAALGIFFFVAACSDNLLDGPTEKDLRNQLSFTLPSGVTVDDLEILVSENIGSEVEPRYRNRAKATITLTDDFVNIVDQYDEKLILKTLFEKGQEFNVTLITTAHLVGERWNVTIDKMDGSNLQGTPLSTIVEGTYAYQGSKEEKEIIEAYEARLEEERIAAEAAAAKAAEEAAEAKVRAEAERVARIEAFRKTLTGTWVSEQPVLRNQNLYTARDSKTASVQITFPEGAGQTGTAQVELYVTDDITDKITINTNFKVDDSGDFATIYLNTRTNHRSLNWTFRENWTFNKDGLFATGGNRDRWYAQMTKDGAVVAEKFAEEERLAKRAAAIEALRVKHRAFTGDRRLRDIGLRQNTFGPVFVDAEKAQKGTVWGDVEEYYGENSSVISAAIHAGVLKEGESGVLNVTYRYLNNRDNINGTLRNGIQSENFSNYGVYKIELIEKLEIE